MVTKAEMHERGARAMREMTTGLRRSLYGRLLFGLMRDQVVLRLSDDPPKFSKIWSPDVLTRGASPAVVRGVQRFLREHENPSTSGDSDVAWVFHSKPGVEAQAEWGAEDARAFVLTQESVRVLLCLTLIQVNRKVSTHSIRTALALTESSWSNVVTSLTNPEVMGPWGTLSWTGRDDPHRRLVTHLGPGEGHLEKLRAIFGPSLRDLIDEAAIPEFEDALDLFEAHPPG